MVIFSQSNRPIRGESPKGVVVAESRAIAEKARAVRNLNNLDNASQRPGTPCHPPK
jgi:hypothetical protein